MKKICLFSSGRADFGQIWALKNQLESTREFLIELISVPGSEESFSAAINGYEPISDYIVGVNSAGKSSIEIGKTIGLNIVLFTDILQDANPDLLIILGDRHEAFAMAITANNLKIPIAHLHGGEVTQGSMDEYYRHCITKLSQLHFASSESYTQRIIQLGENPSRVFNVGSIGIQNIKSMVFLEKHEIEDMLEVKFKEKNFLVTYHPPTIFDKGFDVELNQLLDALAEIDDTCVFFTAPNNDPGNQLIRDIIHQRIEKNSNWYFFESLGQQMYFSLVRQVDAIIGNSSSGIIEIPSLKKPTINLGTRQNGRKSSASVINVIGGKVEILKALREIYNVEFRKEMISSVNYYEKPNTKEEITKIISSNLNQGISLAKDFWDTLTS